MKYLRGLRKLYYRSIIRQGQETRFLILLSLILSFIAERIKFYAVLSHPAFTIPEEPHGFQLFGAFSLLLVVCFIRFLRVRTLFLRFSAIVYGAGSGWMINAIELWYSHFSFRELIELDASIACVLVLLSLIWYRKFWSKFFASSRLYLIRVVNKINKSNPKMKKKYLPVFFGGLFLILLFYVSSKNQSLTAAKNKLRAQKALIVSKNKALKVLAAEIKKIDTPTATPSVVVSATPSATAVPTPVPVGFCLNIPVLLYHHTMPQADAVSKKLTSLNVDNGVFDRQMEYLATHAFHTISAQRLIDALQAHTALPSKSIVVTLDDGYDDNYVYAYPTLKKYGLSATLMVPTGLLGIKTLTNSYYTWDQLKEMVKSGVMTVGDHTWSHYSLGHGSVDKNQSEIMTGKQQLEQNLGVTVTNFAYPYGAGATTPWIIDLLKKDGISGAYSTMGGSMQCDSYIYALKRVRIGNALFPAYGIF